MLSQQRVQSLVRLGMPANRYQRLWRVLHDEVRYGESNYYDFVQASLAQAEPAARQALLQNYERVFETASRSRYLSPRAHQSLCEAMMMDDAYIGHLTDDEFTLAKLDAGFHALKRVGAHFVTHWQLFYTLIEALRAPAFDRESPNDKYLNRRALEAKLHVMKCIGLTFNTEEALWQFADALRLVVAHENLPRSVLDILGFKGLSPRPAQSGLFGAHRLALSPALYPSRTERESLTRVSTWL